MLYIVTALKSEAQAFVEFYKLTKSKLHNFIIYKNEYIVLIISNIGIENSRTATQMLVNHYDIGDTDIYLNIGICASSKQYPIGTFLQIGTIIYDEISYPFNTKLVEITCVNQAVDEAQYSVVDMESFGFYDAVIHNPAIKSFHIFKIVSDHFQPDLVTKDGTKQLLYNAIKKNIDPIFFKDIA